MIDFQNKKYIKLHEASDNEMHKCANVVGPILVDTEEIEYIFTSIRDFVVFTNKRIISVNVQGITGTKKDLTTIPYNRIQTFSVETAGTLDLESELELFISSVGSIYFEFTAGTDVYDIAQLISSAIL